MRCLQPGGIFVSCGESSGDLYSAALVEKLRKHWPATKWYGSAGPRMRKAGVEPLVEMESLAVAGLLEVVSHLPRIYGEYRKLVRAIQSRRPDLVILTDSPDLHLRLAKRVHRMGIPVICLVAPQAWAWRKGRVKAMKRDLARLLCLFPFEEAFYGEHGVPATYIGHPLARLAAPSLPREEFLARHGFRADIPLLALCPGSRKGEIERHWDPLRDAVDRIGRVFPCQFAVASPVGFSHRHGDTFFKERIRGSSIQWIEGETWDVLAHSHLALAASGTVTMEAALLGTPLITYYKVTGLSWLAGRFLVRVPFYSMVNLIAGKRLVTELMQNEMTGGRLAEEALALLRNEDARQAMRAEFGKLRKMLETNEDPMERAARLVRELFDERSDLS